MSDSSHLQRNPFETYRDPRTGRWVTVLCRSEFSCQYVQKRPSDVVHLCVSDDNQICTPPPPQQA